MIATTIAAQRAIMSDSRRWNLILTDGRGNTLESKDGAVISMDHSIEPSSGVLTVGDIFTQNINIELRRSIDDDGTKFDYSTNSEMKIAYSLLDAPGIIHMGSFRVKKVEKAKDRIRLQLKDYFYNELNEKYVPSSSLTYPAPIMDVMQDICGVMSVHLYEPLYLLPTNEDDVGYEPAFDKALSPIYVRTDHPKNIAGTEITVPHAIQGKNVAQALGLCAGLLGCCVVKGRDNSIVCIRPSKVPYTISSDRAADPDFLDIERKIIKMVCNIQNSDPMVIQIPDADDGFKIETDNDLMTSDAFLYAFQDYLGWVMRPATIDHMLGDPRLDPMDIISYRSLYEESAEESGLYTMPLLSLNYHFDGGLSCTLRSDAEYVYEEENNNG